MPAFKVVFDCMIFIQAAARRSGAAGACFDAARQTQIDLFVSSETMAELTDVLGRPELRRRFPSLTYERIDRFIEEVLACASPIQSVPTIYAHPLDKKDEPYINLAIAASADMIATHDQRHMLSLMDRSEPHGIDFTNRFPTIRIVTPERLLAILRAAHSVD